MKRLLLVPLATLPLAVKLLRPTASFEASAAGLVGPKGRHTLVYVTKTGHCIAERG